MLHSTRGMIVETCSGSQTLDTLQRNANGSQITTRTNAAHSSVSPNLRDATLRMGRTLKGVPREVRNVWYAFSRAVCRYSEGHLLGQWPNVSVAFAHAGAPYADVMAPVDAQASYLRREYYLPNLPRLEMIEAMEADAEAQLRRAEISQDVRAIRDAAQQEYRTVELLLDVTSREAATGGTR